MVKTDGTPTIAWADPPQADSCPVLTAPGTVTKIRLRNPPTSGIIAAIQRRHPGAVIEVAA